MEKTRRTYLQALLEIVASVIAALAGMIILVALLTYVGSASATDWHVYEGESIQVVIDNATDGDTIIVHEGIYEEYGACGVVYHNASGIFEKNEVKNIWGLVNETRRPLPWNGDAVSVISNSNVTIHKNYIHNYTYGISFWDSNGTIRKNTLIDNQVGICIKTGWARASSSVTVRDNGVNVGEVGSAPGAGIVITTHKPLGRAYIVIPPTNCKSFGRRSFEKGVKIF